MAKNIHQMHFSAIIPVCGLYQARHTAKSFDSTIVALLGHKNICMLINRNSNLMDAKKEYEDKLKFFVDIELKKQEYRRNR